MGYVDLHNGWFVLSLVGFCGLVFALYMHESERRRMIRHLCREAEELHQWNLAASLRLHPHLSALAALPGSVKEVGDLLEELSKMMWRTPYLVVCSERFPTETDLKVAIRAHKERRTRIEEMRKRYDQLVLQWAKNRNEELVPLVRAMPWLQAAAHRIPDRGLISVVLVDITGRFLNLFETFSLCRLSPDEATPYQLRELATAANEFERWASAILHAATPDHPS